MVEEIRAMWYETLEELLQCPVCLEATQGINFQCINGHHLCKSCRLQLHICPICKSTFIQTRNLAVEQILAKLHDIKLSLLHPYHWLNRKILHNKVCVATQTENVCISATSVACQTEPIIQAKSITRENEEQKQASLLTSKIGRGLYPCRIGSCIEELPYGRIITHLRYYHKNVFYEYSTQNTIFKEKRMLEYFSNHDYDFAFLIKGMGLFFLNISINRAGDLIAYVQIVNCIAMSKQFTYKFEAVGAHSVHCYTGVVKSCRIKDRSHMNILRISEGHMRHIIDNKNFFHYNLIIKRKIDDDDDDGANNRPQNSSINIDVCENALNC